MPKRSNELGQLRKEEYDRLEDSQGEVAGTFKRADEATLKTRRIVKARRPPPAPVNSENPFANVSLTAAAAPAPKEVKAHEASAEVKEKTEDPVVETETFKEVIEPDTAPEEPDTAPEATDVKAEDSPLLSETKVEEEVEASVEEVEAQKEETDDKKEEI